MALTIKTPKQFPWIIPEYCEGCGGCISQCKYGCLDLYETEIPEIYTVWIADASKCTGCGFCGNSCIMGGITMTSYVDMAIERMKNGMQSFPQLKQ
jgi:ferredoxin